MNDLESYFDMWEDDQAGEEVEEGMPCLMTEQGAIVDLLEGCVTVKILSQDEDGKSHKILLDLGEMQDILSWAKREKRRLAKLKLSPVRPLNQVEATH